MRPDTTRSQTSRIASWLSGSEGGLMIRKLATGAVVVLAASALSVYAFAQEHSVHRLEAIQLICICWSAITE
jgi:hypothetical protein